MTLTATDFIRFSKADAVSRYAWENENVLESLVADEKFHAYSRQLKKDRSEHPELFVDLLEATQR